MAKYNPKKIETKWQKYWEKNKTFEVGEDTAKKKFYGLVEFPYPSGAGLHVGHPRSYTAMDVICRKKRMEGLNVLYPIGFDAFGLPTENFAIKTGRPPAEVTEENIVNFTRQLKMLGYSFDWSRSVDTTDPKYYKWTQWIFLQLFKHGLAYKKNQPINWCSACKIGLANEEAVDGECERCGAKVEKRNKEQWMLAITKYADSLLRGLKEVDYIERAKVQQENWIGKSEGTLIKFAVKRHSEELGDEESSGSRGSFADAQYDGYIEVFTTRPDTLFGATYMVVAPEHRIIQNFKSEIENWNEVEKYIEASKKKSDLERTELQKEKSGVELKGIKAINPATSSEIPIWVADYVLSGYGTGAIMAVPAHDERDFEFAKKYGLPITEVVIKIFGEKNDNEVRRDGVKAIIVKDGKVLLNKETNNFYSLVGGGLDENESQLEALKREIHEETGYISFDIKECLGSIESHGFSTKINDNRVRFITCYIVELLSDKRDENLIDREESNLEWIEFSKAIEKLSKNTIGGEQEFVERYLDRKRACFAENGAVINSDFLNGLKIQEAKEKIISWLKEKGIGQKKVQFKLHDWVFSRQRYWGEPIPLVHCEKCNGWIPLPEDQLPLELPKLKNYQPTDTGESPLSTVEKWVNTTCPNCGGPAMRETDTMPNWAGSSWYFLRYLDPKNDKELASKEAMKYWMNIDWYNGGMEHTVLHLLYSRFWNQFLYDIGVVPAKEPYQKRTSHGMILAKGGEKMSKSRGNVINPDEIVEEYGADALRVYIMFMGPFDQAVEWDTNGLVGVRRFLERVWNLQEKVTTSVVILSPDSIGVNSVRDPFVLEKTKINSLLHRTIRKITEDIEAMRFNTAIAKLMELSNEIGREEKISIFQFQIFVKLLYPFAPHICEELWEKLGNGESIAFAPWPEYDEELAKESEITIALQVNGKVRDELKVSAEITEEEIKNLALESGKVQKWLDGKAPKKVIYVKGKLVSISV